MPAEKTPGYKLALGRNLACQYMPYFRSAIFSMVVKEMPGLKTMGVTKDGVMYWDPEAVSRWTTEEVAAVILHEVSHLLRDHCERADMMGIPVTDRVGRMGWNIAADAEINDDLEDAGVKLPGEAIMPETLGMDRGLAAEQYYQNARKMAQDSADQAEQLLKDAMSGWEITEDGKVRNPETGEEVDPNGDDGDQDGEGSGEGKKPGEKGSTCGGAAGNPMPHENPDGTDADGDGKSEAQMNAVRKQVAKAVQEEAAKGRGRVPAGLSRWADTQLAPPKVDWRRKLSQCIRTACAFRPGAVDFKYDRPSRRQGAFGYRNAPVLPALRRPVPRVSVAIDTSGSMGKEELETAIQETNGILKSIGAEVSMYICDARTEGRVRVRDVKDLKDHLLGGGGTDFRPVFEAVEKERPRPEILIFITDGGGPAPDFCPPGLNVIWCLVGQHREKPCDWGTFIEIDDE